MFEAWQMRAWKTLHDAAEARYEMQRAMIKDRLAKLQEEMGSQDPLSLRKIEREEVMKGVLRWLFGPSVLFRSAGTGRGYYGTYRPSTPSGSGAACSHTGRSRNSCTMRSSGRT